MTDVEERNFSQFVRKEEQKEEEKKEEEKEEVQHQISGYGSSSSSLHFPKILSGLLKIQIIDTGMDS